MRIVLTVSYKGTNYQGWARQPGLVTVQGVLEEAITKVANAPTQVFCAGRTDKGVHALSQVAHFDTESKRDKYEWLRGINSNLPADVRLNWLDFVGNDDFHARFSATSRTYHYYISTKKVSSAIFAEHMLWVPHNLNISAMQAAATYLLGEHDFSSFRSRKCQAASPIKKISKLDVVELKPDLFVVVISANSFLYNMVRNIVGLLLKIARGDAAPIWAQEVLSSCTKGHNFTKVRAEGLYFMGATYPRSFKIECCDENYLF
ncbi:MAG: tRNA pseudouridine(38-40) synthase TruA [Pseudomonadota bacterium]|nr:tRNA pseudouridine(38-40) synthase TruA [Pseudomonadota bacterium]